MKKRQLIIGEKRSGKSFLSRSISMAFSNPVFLPSWEVLNRNFKFHQLCSDTDLIIVDEVKKSELENVSSFFYAKYLNINKRNEKPFKIERPHIIIICEVLKQEINQSILNRFEVINTTYIDNIFTFNK